MITSINPATGEQLAEYEPHSDDEVRARIERAHEAWSNWAHEPFSRRAQALRRAASLLRERQDKLGLLMAREMGKPITQGEGEAAKCAWVCEYYAENAARFLADEIIDTDASRSKVVYRPLGVVLAVMPWNFPLWQVFRFAAPALMAGNGVLLKHASNVAGCAQAIEVLLRDAGVPEDLFQALLVGSDRVGDIIEHPLVAGVTLTGSVGAGRAVGSAAGKALKKSVLELGGSDPYIVLEDADIEHAAQVCVKSRLINCGQSCIAAKRFIVVEQVLSEFIDRMVEHMRAAKVGDPQAPDTEVGPLAREDLRDDLHEQVRKSVEKGARVALGGEIPDRAGAWYPPTVLTGVRPGMPAWDEELFGPVAAVVSAHDEEDAIQLANDSRFGLGAAVFTRDTTRGERIAADRLQAGACFVNGLVKSDPRLPFGGIKESGYGRELARPGILEFVNTKTVWIR